MEIVYKVSPTFVRFHQDDSKMKFVMGPVGSGKSSGCIWDLFFNACKQRPDEDGIRHSRYAVIRGNYPQLRSSTVKSFLEWFKDKITIVYSTPILGKLKYKLEDGTSIDMEIMFIAIDDEVAAEKLRSWEFTGAWVNEAHDIPEYLMTILLERFNRFPSRRSGGAVDPQILVDYNAISTDHWLYHWAEEKRPENATFYKQPPAVLRDQTGHYSVNPEAENIENLSEDYYPNIWLVSSPEMINTDLMNNYGERKSGKAVYQEFIDSEHTAPAALKPPLGVKVVIGLDQGLHNAAAFMYQDASGCLVVFDEIAGQECSLREFAEDYIWPKINAKYPWIRNNFICKIDPAALQRSMNDAKAGLEILKECRLPVTTAKTNSPLARQEAVKFFLNKKKKFLLSPECSILRKGFISGYRFEQKRVGVSGQFKEKPEKNEFSHVHDALQYGALEFLAPSRTFSARKAAQPYRPVSLEGGY